MWGGNRSPSTLLKMTYAHHKSDAIYPTPENIVNLIILQYNRMKQFFLIRHGKSSWDEPALSDTERPLKKRGKKDVAVMGKFLRKQNIQPDVIISSPAERALATAKIIAEQTGYEEQKISISEEIYFEGIESILKAVRKMDDKHSLIFVFGHNPDFTELVNHYSEKTIDNLPTSGVAGITFNVKSWKEITGTNGKLTFFEVPKNHR